MRKSKLSPMPNKDPSPLTDKEINWLARALLMLAEIPEWRQRCRLIAIACKVGIFEEDNPRYERLREQLGLSR